MNFVCKTCGKIFFSHDAHDRHMKFNHKEKRKRHHCRYCNADFTRDTYKLLHERDFLQKGSGMYSMYTETMIS